MTADETERQRKGTILVVEDDSSIGHVVQGLLTDEGYAASVLSIASSETIRAAVGRLEPDCVLLDSAARGDYGSSWVEAIWAQTRRRPVPVVMFTANKETVLEAEAQQSDRSAAIYGVIGKPFDIDALLDTVAKAVGSVPRFDRAEAGEIGRTAALVAQLEAAGAQDVRASAQREWASFYAHNSLTLIYWSQRDGIYYVLRQPLDTGVLQPVGSFHDLDVAVAIALVPQPTP